MSAAARVTSARPLAPPLDLTDTEVARYLRVLGVERARPSLDALGRLVRAQLCRVPFENVSKLYYRRQQGRRELPGLELFLDGIERHRFGGTCYLNNFHFFRLLRALGYEAKLCGADMASGPDVHMAIRVRLGGRELLVDVGYAAPFYEPIPLDLPAPFTIRFGRDTYVVHPQDGGGRTSLELQRDGERAHGYLLKPAARTIAHFARVIRASYRPGATFMRSLLLVRFFDSQSVTILNRLRIDSGPDGFSLRELATTDRVVEEIVSAFDMEEEIVRAAVDGFLELESPYG
jgi:N-hydroxyarylamine O-acetyltransferase